MKKIKSLLLATSVIILGDVSPIQAFELESKSDPEPKRFLWEMVGSGRWQRTDGRSKAQMFLDSVWGEERQEGSPFDDGGSFFSGSGSGDGKSMMSGGGGSVATLSTAVTHRAEENSRKTDFLAPLSNDFFRYNAPMPYGDDMIWFSFSPLAGTNPEAFLKVFGDLLERLKDEVRLGFVLRNLDQLTEETTQSFMNSFSDIVQRTISAQTEEEDVQRILSIEGEVPSRVITNIQSGPDQWQWLQYVDLSAATSSSPASGDRPALGRLLALPSMRHINLSHASLSSEELRSIIERCAEAQAEFSLDLSHTQLNDAVVEQIKKLLEETTYCRSLRLRNTGLNDEALEQIYDVFEEREMLDEPITVDIDITANPLSEKMFNKWRQAMSESLFETVISTSLAGNYNDYKNDADVLKAFNEALNVEGPGVIIKGVRHISVRSLGELAQGMLRRPHLTELHFIDSPLPEAEDRLTPLMPVFTNGHITHLSFENVNFDFFDAECLYRALHTSATWADNFMSLNLSRNYLGSVIVPPLKPLLKKAKKLRRFNMAGNILGSGTSMLLINLANHKELEHLNLQANMITDKEMSKLWKWLGRGKLVGLKELDLAYNPANHEVFPQDIREGLAVRLDGLAMGEEMLNQWNTHTGGRINANTQSLTTLWQGMHAYVPLEYRGEVESAPTELWETSGQGTLMGGLKHVRLTGQPLLEGFQWKTHGEEVIASFKGAESLTVKGLSPELVPPLTRLLNTSPQLRSFSLKTGEGWQLEHVNGLLKAVPGGASGPFENKHTTIATNSCTSTAIIRGNGG